MSEALPERAKDIFHRQNELARIKYASSSEDEDDGTPVFDSDSQPSGPGSGPLPLPDSKPDDGSDGEDSGADDSKGGGGIRATTGGESDLPRTDGSATEGEARREGLEFDLEVIAAKLDTQTFTLERASPVREWAAARRPESSALEPAIPVTAKPRSPPVPTTPEQDTTSRRTSSRKQTYSSDRSTRADQSAPSFPEYFHNSALQTIAVEIKIQLMLHPCLIALKYHKINPVPAKDQAKIRNAAALALKLAKEYEGWVQPRSVARCHFYNGLTDLIYSKDAAKKRGLRARKHFGLTIALARKLRSSIDEEILARQWIEWIDHIPPRQKYGGERLDHDGSDSDKDDYARPRRDSYKHSRPDTSETLSRWKRAIFGSGRFSSGRPITSGSHDDKPDTSYTGASMQGWSRFGLDRPFTTQESMASSVRPAPLRLARRTSLRTDILKHPPIGVTELHSPGAAREVYSPGAAREVYSPGTARAPESPYTGPKSNRYDQISPKDVRELRSPPAPWLSGPFLRWGNPFTPSSRMDADQEPYSSGTAQASGSPYTAQRSNRYDQLSPRDMREPRSPPAPWWPGSFLRWTNPFMQGRGMTVVESRRTTTGTALEPWLEDRIIDGLRAQRAKPRLASSPAIPAILVPSRPSTRSIATAIEATPNSHVSRRHSRSKSVIYSTASPVRPGFELRQHSDRILSLQERHDDDPGTSHEPRRSRLGSVTTALSWSRQAPRSPEALLEEGENLLSDSPATPGSFGNGRSVGETW